MNPLVGHDADDRALGAPDPAVVLVPVAEITLGVMLVGGWWLTQTVIAGILLLGAFTVLLLVRLRDEERGSRHPSVGSDDP